MMARRLPSIVPSMTVEEALEATNLRSVSDWGIGLGCHHTHDVTEFLTGSIESTRKHPQEMKRMILLNEALETDHRFHPCL